MSEPSLHEIATALTKQLLDRGQIVEAGWVGFRTMTVPPSAPQVQLDAMRGAFYAGAQHLFSSIMAGLDPDAEPTADDLRRMDKIKSELDEYVRQFKAKHGL